MNLIPCAEIAAGANSMELKQTFSSLSEDNQVTVGIRPEHIELAVADGISCKVSGVEYLGADILAECLLEQTSLLVRLPGSTNIAVDDSILVSWQPEKMVFFDQNSGQRIEPNVVKP
jgi:sn-glycerol 3-phosphate transport system ATP-binding protein